MLKFQVFHFKNHSLHSNFVNMYVIINVYVISFPFQWVLLHGSEGRLKVEEDRNGKGRERVLHDG